jgi:hypothetical protein
MNPRLYAVALAALLSLAPGLGAQSHLSVPLSDRLYTLLEIAELRGILPKLPAVRPYPESRLRDYLHRIGESSGRLSAREREIYRELMADLEARAPSLGRFSIAAQSEVRMGIEEPERVHNYTAGTLSLSGDLLPWLSYNLNVGQTFEVANPTAFAPFAFSKPWDGQPVGKGIILTSSGPLTFHVLTNPELAISLFDDRFLIRWARTRREWGVGDGSLLLAGTARPFDGIELSGQLTKWAWFHYVTGTLGDWLDSNREQKMISAHLGELMPLPWLYLSVWESVIWGKRLELSYLNPFISYAAAQVVSVGNLDNLAMGADLALTWPRRFRWYFSLYLDEFNAWKLKGFFQNPMNMYAWYTGLKVPIPGLALTLLTLQYTKIEPYCYTHYLQDYPFFDVPQNINYTNDGENLGYPLPPNSDEFRFKLQSLVSSRLELSALYQLIRHGDGDHTLGQIEGDINVPIDYATADSYPRKHFLHDGIYKWINILRISSSYSFDFGLTVWGEYGFIHARNFRNIEGNTAVKNLFAIGVRFSH